MNELSECKGEAAVKAFKKKNDSQKRKNPVIADWVHVSEGSTEGSLGGWLAQRQAALREVMAAGALSTFTLGLPCVPMISRAPSVPEKDFFGMLELLGIGQCANSL